MKIDKWSVIFFLMILAIAVIGYLALNYHPVSDDGEYREKTFLEIIGDHPIPWTIIEIGFVAFYIMLVYLVNIRRNTICPPKLAEELAGLLKENRYDEAQSLAQSQDNSLANIMSATLHHASSGLEPMSVIAEEMVQSEAVKLRNRVSYLMMIGISALILGGYGMANHMVSSSTIFEPHKPGPSAVQVVKVFYESIGSFGLGCFVAIIALGSYWYFSWKVKRLMAEIRLTCFDLLGIFRLE